MFPARSGREFTGVVEGAGNGYGMLLMNHLAIKAAAAAFLFA